jgi:hypothetical protein
MTYEDFKNMIDSMGMPAAYYQWPVNMAPPLPYVVFYYPSSDNFTADDEVYTKIESVNLELYTANKSFDAEASVESVLKANHIPWQKTESYLDSEHMYEVLYELEIVING